MMKASKKIKRFLRKVKEKVSNFCAGVQKEPVKEHSNPGIVDHVTAASCSVGVTSNDGRPNRASSGVESTPTATHTMPDGPSVEINLDCLPWPIGSAAAQDHPGRSAPTIGVSPQPGISPCPCGAITTTVHHIHSLYTPREGIILHAPHPHQRTVMAVTDNDIGPNMFQHESLRPLSMDNSSPCQCSHLRGSGRTGRTIFAVIPEVYREDTSYHHATSPAPDLPSCSGALHSADGRWLAPCVTPHSPPYVLHDAHSYLNDRESFHSNPSPLVWVAPPACGHLGPSSMSPAWSHQLENHYGRDVCPRVLQANDVGSSRTLPQRLSSRSYSTGSMHAHFAHAGPRLTRSQSVLVGHAPSRASHSTMATSPYSPPPVPLTTRSDTPPRRAESETTAEVGCEKLPPDN